MPEHHEVPNPIHHSVLPSLDPTFVKLYNEHIANIPNKPIDLNSLRSNYSVLYSYATAPAPEASKTWDAKIPGYQGLGSQSEFTSQQVRVHGRYILISTVELGWGLGDLDTESQICKHIVSLASVAVIDVAYRLVPENPFPTGILDSLAALKYIVSPYGVEQFNINPTKISIGGVSAGGNIALVLAHLARDAGIPLRLVAAVTPCVDDLSRYKTAKESPYKSMQEMEFAPTLDWRELKWFDNLKWSSLSNESEVRKKQMADVKWFADLMSAPNFKNLGKTVIYTAGCDPLRDEGEAYGRKLVEDGNEVTMKRFEGVPHAFMHMDAALPQAKHYIEMLSEAIMNSLVVEV